MRYLMCIKQAPDTAELSKIKAEEAASGNLSVQLVVNPWDEHALEGGIQMSEKYGGATSAITVGGDGALEALRSALAMGCKEATLIKDTTADAWGVAVLLAGAVKKIGDVTVVVMGQATIDGASGTVPAALGRALAWPVLTGVAKVVEATPSSVTVERAVGQERQTVTVPVPCILSVIKEIGEPRYPTFINIRKATKVEIPTWTAADLGVSVPAPVVHMSNFRKPPARDAKVVMFNGSIDDAASKLIDALLADKVL